MVIDAARVTPSVNATCTRMSTGSHNEVIFGTSWKIANSTTRPDTAISVSTAATHMLATGNTSRGQYTLFSRLTLVTRLRPPWFSDVAKNVHGSSPRYDVSGYGASPVLMRATCWNTRVNTSMRARGVMIAQAIPRKACL